MNRFLTPAQVGLAIGMPGRSARLVQRRLVTIARERGEALQLPKLGRSWHVTQADLFRILPELAPDPQRLAELREELRVLRTRVARAEKLWLEVEAHLGR